MAVVTADGDWADAIEDNLTSGSPAWQHARDRVAALDGEIRDGGR